MSPRTTSRIVGGLSGPLAVVLLILFFVPWVDLKCGSTRVGSASGFQLTFGRMTTSPEFDEQRADEKDADDGPDARPWFILGLLVPLALLTVSALMLEGKWRIPGGTLLTILAAVGVVVIICAANVDYRDEIAREESSATKPQDSSPISSRELSAMLSTETRGAVWASLAFYILIVLLGAAGTALPVALRRIGAKERASPTDLCGQPYGQKRSDK